MKKNNKHKIKTYLKKEIKNIYKYTQIIIIYKVKIQKKKLMIKNHKNKKQQIKN